MFTIITLELVGLSTQHVQGWQQVRRQVGGDPHIGPHKTSLRTGLYLIRREEDPHIGEEE
jgi:hypothetical protein